MGKYRIQMFYPKTRLMGYVEVRGYPVSIPWVKGVGLFIHHPFSTGSLWDSMDTWNISEAKSGLALITNCVGTREQAVEALKAKLGRVKTDNISLWLKAMIKKHIANKEIANPVALEVRGNDAIRNG